MKATPGVHAWVSCFLFLLQPVLRLVRASSPRLHSSGLPRNVDGYGEKPTRAPVCSWRCDGQLSGGGIVPRLCPATSRLLHFPRSSVCSKSGLAACDRGSKTSAFFSCSREDVPCGVTPLWIKTDLLWRNYISFIPQWCLPVGAVQDASFWQSSACHLLGAN